MEQFCIEDWVRLISAAVSALALALGVWSYVQKLRLDHYTEFDKLYADIVKLRIANPHVATPPSAFPTNAEMPEDQELKYDAYALLVWNFIETFYDRGKGYRKLRRTWRPILNVEGIRHAKWLTSNTDKFKVAFLIWASQNVDGLNQFIDQSGKPRSGAGS